MHSELRDYALGLLREAGFQVDLTSQAAAQLDALPVGPAAGGIMDLTHLPWSSIDNPTTRDVDQLEYAEAVPGGTRVLVAIADVDEWVPRGSPLDLRAGQNTVSVYGGEVLLPMLPERLSEGLSSLLADQPRLAVIAEFVASPDGVLNNGKVYRALVKNAVQLDYETINAWLSGAGPLPAKAAQMEEQLRLQNDAAERLRGQRERLGALEFQRNEVRPVVKDGRVVDMVLTHPGPARDLIEDFMIAANATIAGFLEKHDVSWIRRMVGAPERWSQIAALIREGGGTAPDTPDRTALAAFLNAARARDPENFASVSLSVLRLLGSGEYMVEHRAEDLGAHFALAVEDYTHFTAPNRRYADVVTQRIVKAVLAGEKCPYGDVELEEIAAHCSRMEDAARAVERKVVRYATMLLMQPRVGETFDAVVADASKQDARIMLTTPVIEGRLDADGVTRKDGDSLRVRLTAVDVAAGRMTFSPA
ncbi:MAG TPA: RNB domain-containing ribonuclease [Longimicrobiales bacterium]